LSGRSHSGAILDAVASVVGHAARPVALHEPELRGREQAYVAQCISTGWVSSLGAFVDKFEASLADYTGAARAVATVNGTAALHACLLLVGVRPGDEVLLPTLTFIATANAVSYCHAIPHFVDSEPQTFGVDPAKLEAYLSDLVQVRDGDCINRHSGRRIGALVCMHVFGHPADLQALTRVCDRFNLPLVEDAAESLGSLYRGKHTGRFGRVAALSFNGNKVVTTGGGGAILTDDPELGRAAKHLTTTARTPHRWSFLHDEVGYNYRLPNINAALGCAQMEQLPGMLERKRALAQRYAAAFARVEGVRFVTEPVGSRSNYWLNTLLLDDSSEASRDALLEVLNEAGYMARPVWTLMHRLPMYGACPRMDVACAEDLERRIVNIPSSAALGELQ
jgi:perosamine synthetase